MLEQLVALDFPCGGCGRDVNVTVKCSGKGLAVKPAAAFSVACPLCAVVNRVVFEPSGKVHQVTADEGFPRRWEPSAN